jgi:hypothetical protein
MSTPTRDIHDNLAPSILIAPAVPTADTTLIVADLIGFRAAMVNIWVGVGGITFSGVNRVDFVMSHSVDNSNWDLVTQADVIGVTGVTSGIVRSLIAAKAAADTGGTKFSYIGGRRYIRLLGDFSGTHGAGTPMFATCIRGLPEQLPAA